MCPIVSGKLQNRFDVFLIAMCAHIMLRNIAVGRRLKAVHQTARFKTVQAVVLFFMRKVFLFQQLVFKVGAAAQERRLFRL